VRPSGELPLRAFARAELEKDMAALDTDALRREAAKMMLRLRRRPQLRRRLSRDARTGDLSDCRKLYFDEARHRIVYRLYPSDDTPMEVEIIAVGPRANLDVYRRASERLGR
jgi:hypothetical protein